MEMPYKFPDRGTTVQSADNQPYEPAKSVACDDAVLPLKCNNSNVSDTGSSEKSKPTRNRSMSVFCHPSEKQQSATVFKTEEIVSCFALIEWDTDDGEPAAYTVIESSQIVAEDGSDLLEENRNGRRKSDSGLYTGKLIHVRRGRYIMPATIVMISEDKTFLETELQQLRIMAANNMINKSVTQTHPVRKQQLPTLTYYGGSSHKAPTAMRVYGSDDQWTTNKAVKRQRCDSGSSISLKDGARHFNVATSTNSVQEGNGVNEERALSISSEGSLQSDSPPPVRTKVARYRRMDHRTSSRYEAPPMTFDQQTQTTGGASDAYDAHFTRIVSYLESIMAEQKSSRMESEYNRRLLHELQEKMLDQHTILTDVRKQLTEMESKQQEQRNEVNTQPRPNSDLIVTRVSSKYGQRSEGNGVNKENVFSYESTNNNHIVVSGLRGADAAEQWVRVQNVNQIVTEEDHPTNSNLSWASTTGMGSNSTQTTIATTTNGTVADDATPKENSLFIEFESEIVNTVESSSASSTAVQDLLKDDWDDSQHEKSDAGSGKAHKQQQKKRSPEQATTVEGSEEKVSIGTNNTLVPKTILDTIPWGSYKSATRRLLQTVFSREMLARSSLSGRPCPALHNSGRPVKAPLPPKMVADIIECVVQRCKVGESLVRSAITTKCADENKMLRMRMSSNETSGSKKKVAAGRVGKRSDLYDKENCSADN